MRRQLIAVAEIFARHTQTSRRMETATEEA